MADRAAVGGGATAAVRVGSAVGCAAGPTNSGWYCCPLAAGSVGAGAGAGGGGEVAGGRWPVQVQLLYPELGIKQPLAAVVERYELDLEALAAAAQSALAAPDRVVVLEVRSADAGLRHPHKPSTHPAPGKPRDPALERQRPTVRSSAPAALAKRATGLERLARLVLVLSGRL